MMGNLPLFDETFTPRRGRISSKKSIGLARRLPEPWILIFLLLKASMGVNILIPKPLSPQSTVSGEPIGPSNTVSVLSMINKLFLDSSLQFRAFRIAWAARSSFEWPGLWMKVLFRAMSAAAQALCMELFEAGARIVPFNVDGEMIASM